jgi:NTP pyrophosphatase (non-canonical NTP hydrolase)
MSEFRLDPIRLAVAGDVLCRPAQHDAHWVREYVAFLVAQCYGAALAAGWHTDLTTGQPKPLAMGTKLMLVVSELAEGMEGHRKGLTDDKLPHRSMLEVELADAVIRVCDTAGAASLDLSHAFVDAARGPSTLATVADKTCIPERLLAICETVGYAHQAHRADVQWAARHLASALLGIGRLADDLKLDLGGAIADKMRFNAQRADHKPEARLAAGGKAY